MNSSYFIKLLDYSGSTVAMFSGSGRGGARGNMRALNYAKRLRYPGEFMVTIDGNDERIPLFNEDYQVEFHRRDADGGLDWYKDFSGFVRSFEFQQNDQGQDVFIARGRGYNDLLLSETINYYAGTAYTAKSGPAETVAKEFVNENIGPGAGVDALGFSRVRPGLSVEPTAGTGLVWTGARAYKSLFDVCIELAEFAPGDFMIEGTGPATFEFRWKNVRWGKDKTVSNTDGNAPVIFGSNYGNATNFQYSLSYLDAVNVVYVLGQGVGTARMTATTADNAALAASPWGRRAVSRQATNENTTAALNATGEETINNQRARAKLMFSVMQTKATRYGRDWDIGDLVTVVYTKTNTARDMKITGVQIVVNESGEESIVPEVEDA